MKSSGKLLDLREYCISHITHKLKHSYHKHCLTGREWVNLVKGVGLKIVNYWGLYGISLIAEK